MPGPAGAGGAVGVRHQPPGRPPRRPGAPARVLRRLPRAGRRLRACPCACSGAEAEPNVGFPVRQLAAEEGVLFADRFVTLPRRRAPGRPSSTSSPPSGPGLTELTLRPAIDTPSCGPSPPTGRPGWPTSPARGRPGLDQLARRGRRHPHRLPAAPRRHAAELSRAGPAGRTTRLRPGHRVGPSPATTGRRYPDGPSMGVAVAEGDQPEPQGAATERRRPAPPARPPAPSASRASCCSTPRPPSRCPSTPCSSPTTGSGWSAAPASAPGSCPGPRVGATPSRSGSVGDPPTGESTPTPTRDRALGRPDARPAGHRPAPAPGDRPGP